MTSPPGLHLDAVAISLGDRRLLSLDRSIAPGETLSVMGPSGSGKSTLFAFIAGFLDPAFRAQGRVVLIGEPISDRPPEARHVGLLFQDALLFPHMSVGGNLLFAVPGHVKRRAERRSRAEAMLSRVGLARTLIAEPRALLLDEPFSRLDAPLRRSMRDLVFGLVAERRIPALLVTHDREDAEAAGGPIIELGACSEEMSA